MKESPVGSSWESERGQKRVGVEPTTSNRVEGSPATHLWGRALRASWGVWILVAGLLWALFSGNLLLLHFVHVISAVLWTGTDLFVALILSRVMSRLDPPSRRNVVSQLAPRMVVFLPVVAAVTTTAGWYLAVWEKVPTNPSLHALFLIALGISFLLFVQGVGILLPTNIRLYLELQKAPPDIEKVQRLSSRYMRLITFQGLLQVAIIVVMVMI